MNARIAVAALACLLAAAPVRAQDATLDRIQNLINTGRLTEARNTLAQWEKTHADPRSTATPADRARALLLTGVLSTDPKDAENAFVGVVLSYPSSAAAPEALLRLGQGLYTGGDARRAIAYLERLRSDYPGTPQRETGALWLARAHFANGAANTACATAQSGLDETANANLRTLIEIERDKACSDPRTRVVPAANALPNLDIAVDPEDGAPPAPRVNQEPPPLGQREPPRPTDAAPPPAGTSPVRVHEEPPPVQREPPRRSAASEDIGEYAVQTAAFRDRRAADGIAAELRTKGFDARVVTVAGSPLFRVRFGTFTTNREAADASQAIRDAGFATLIVNDVRLETRVQ